MQKRTKVMLLGVITALTLALPLAAQNYDSSVLGSAPGVASNTNVATSGIFKTDVDNFINYHKYSSVLKDGSNWFGFITGRQYNIFGNPNSGKLQAGYARSFGGIYLGVLYQGNVYQNTSGGSWGSPYWNGNLDKTVSMTPTYDNDTQVLKQVETKTDYEDTWLNFTNQIEFLIGIGDTIGIKVGFLESLYANENEATKTETVTDYKNGKISYSNVTDEYTATGGTLKPYLGFGISLPVAGGTLMPYLDASVDIFSETLIDKYRSYDTYNGVVKNETKTIDDGNDTGYLRPVAKIGAKFDLPKKDSTQTTLEAYYKIDMTMYSSSSSATGFGGDVDGTVNWENVTDVTNTYVNRTEKTSRAKLNIQEFDTPITHTGALNYKVTGEPSDGFRLGFFADVNVGYSSFTQRGYADTYTISDTKYNDGTSTYTTTFKHEYEWENEQTTLSVTPSVALGASFKVIPDRFTVNAGIRAYPTALSYHTVTAYPKNINSIETSKTVDESGDVTSETVTVSRNSGDSDKVESGTTWDGFRSIISGGFVFYFNPTAALDLGLSTSANDFKLDLANVHVLLSVKF